MPEQPPSSELAGGVGPTQQRKTFPCDTCGSQLVFAIGVQKLRCEHCGNEQELVFAEGAAVAEQDLDAALQRQGQRRTQQQDQNAGAHEVRCGSCGATVVFSDTLTSSECGYCGGPIQRKDAHSAQDRLPVDGVCAFAVEKDEAHLALKQWVGSRWFAPTEFTTRGVNEKFKGVYMPYFTFDAMTFTRYRGQRGDAYYVTERHGDEERKVRKINWTHVSGTLQRFFDDVCIPALKSLPASLLQKLEPWPLDKLLPFTDQVLSGKLAHTYEVEIKDCFQAARTRMEEEIRGDVRSDIGGDEQRVEDIANRFTALTYKHILLPVWILAYRYQQKTYRVVVNAMTGEVQGERPYSALKIALAVAAAVLTAVVLWVLFGKHGGGPPRLR